MRSSLDGVLSTGALCARLSGEVAPSLACARGMWERVACVFPRFLAHACQGFVLSRAHVAWCCGGSCNISPISASDVLFGWSMSGGFTSGSCSNIFRVFTTHVCLSRKVVPAPHFPESRSDCGCTYASYIRILLAPAWAPLVMPAARAGFTRRRHVSGFV